MADDVRDDGRSRVDEARGAHRGVPAGRVLAVQLVAYLLLFVVTVGLQFVLGVEQPVVRGVVVAMVAVLLLGFQLGWPFRTGWAERFIGLVAGVLSVVCAVTPAASHVFYPAYGGRLADEGKPVMYTLVRWAACFAILLIAVTIVSFGRQMARAERSHLIRALSHCMTGAVAAVSAAGWCFLPDLVSMGAASPDDGLMTGFLAVMAVCVVFAALFAVCSVPWAREADPAEDARVPWLGIGLLPVMLCGVMIFAAAFVMQLLA
ncbi:hypothetical protein [Bifidobacterium leontopitheci]|nr:hypothetical protein [Bifidobacterium leontopitheci]